MIVKKTDTGEIFSGTPQEIVHQLNTTSRNPAASDSEFMIEVSERMVLQVGHRISTDSPDKFLADLIEAKMMIEEATRDFDPAQQVE